MGLSPQKTVLLAGASGLVGGLVLQRLLADKRVKTVLAPTRRALPLSHKKLVNTVVDTNDSNALDALQARFLNDFPKAIEAFVSCLGTTIKTAGSKEGFIAVDRDLLLRFALMGKQLGAEQAVLVSSVGASRQSSNFYLRIKGESEAALQTMGFARVDILRPGLLLGVRSEKRSSEAIAQKILPVFNPFLMGHSRRYRAIQADAVAAAALRYLFETEAGVHLHEYDEMMSA